MKLITTGGSRLVLLIGNYAIKFPRFNGFGWGNFVTGLYCSIKERNNWRDMNNSTNSLDAYSVNQYFCPVLFCFGGFILIMPRVELCTSESDILQAPKFEDEDRHIDNYGYLNGQLVCIDYPHHKIK